MSALDLVRVCRAIHLDLARRDDATWEVTSANSFHLVTIADNGLLCDCQDFAIRGGPCKHIIRVGLANGDREVISALRLLIPNPRRYPAAKRPQGAGAA